MAGKGDPVSSAASRGEDPEHEDPERSGHANGHDGGVVIRDQPSLAYLLQRGHRHTALLRQQQQQHHGAPVEEEEGEDAPTRSRRHPRLRDLLDYGDGDESGADDDPLFWTDDSAPVTTTTPSSSRSRRRRLSTTRSTASTPGTTTRRDLLGHTLRVAARVLQSDWTPPEEDDLREDTSPSMVTSVPRRHSDPGPPAP